MNENIYIEEEIEIDPTKGGDQWTEQISVAGGQLVETIQSLLREAVVRKITVVDKDGSTLLDIPLYAGILGVAVLGYWTVLALIAAWFTEVSVRIVRAEMPADAPEGEPVVSTASLNELAERAGKGLNEAAERAGTSMGDWFARAGKAASDMAARAADALEPQANGDAADAVAELPPRTSANAAAKETAEAAAEPQRCQATTQAGTQCKRNALSGSDYCAMHQPA
jgi:hypothetical protein